MARCDCTGVQAQQPTKRQRKTIRKNAEINKELNSLLLRAKWTHWAIALTTISALFICLLIAMIFIATKVSFDLDHYLIILFIVAMTSLVFGLLCFLREVSLSKGVIKL